MFSNPFTPESKKAKKSLFKSGYKMNSLSLNRLSALERIKVSLPLELLEQNIPAEQLRFFKDLKFYITLKLLKDHLEILEKDIDHFLIDAVKQAFGFSTLDENHNVKELFLYDPFNRIKIETLPPSIAKLIKLRTLSINCLGLKQLPTNFADLKELESLTVEDNLSPKCLEILIKMKHLKNLVLPKVFSRKEHKLLKLALPNTKIEYIK